MEVYNCKPGKRGLHMKKKLKENNNMEWEKYEKIQKENKGEKSFVIIGIILLFIFVVASVEICSTLFGSGNYPFRFHKQMNEFFGKNNWECVETEAYRTDVGTKYRKELSCKRWYIEYAEDDGTKHTLKLDNYLHELRSSNYFFLQKKYLSNQICFASELHDYLLEIVQDEIEEDFVIPFLGTEEQCNYQIYYSNLGNTGKSYYKNFFKNIEEYKLSTFRPELLMKQEEEHYLKICVVTEGKTQEERKKMDEKVCQLKKALLSQYKEGITFEIEVRHKEQETEETYCYFAYRGNELSEEEVLQSIGERNHADIHTYLTKMYEKG